MNTHLNNLWMATSGFWNTNEGKLLCYLRLNRYKFKEYLCSESCRAYIISLFL